MRFLSAFIFLFVFCLASAETSALARVLYHENCQVYLNYREFPDMVFVEEHELLRDLLALRGYIVKETNRPTNYLHSPGLFLSIIENVTTATDWRERYGGPYCSMTLNRQERVDSGHGSISRRMHWDSSDSCDLLSRIKRFPQCRITSDPLLISQNPEVLVHSNSGGYFFWAFPGLKRIKSQYYYKGDPVFWLRDGSLPGRGQWYWDAQGNAGAGFSHSKLSYRERDRIRRP